MSVETMRRSFSALRSHHPLPPAQTREASARDARYFAFIAGRAGRRGEALRWLRTAAAHSSWNQQLPQLLWVFVFGREWPARSLRRIRDRRTLRDASAWLSAYR